MSANRKPSNILELAGAFKKDPQRARKNEPVPEGNFPKSPPRDMDPDVKKAWKAIVKCCAPGVLTSADVLAVEMLANLLAQYRKNPIKFPDTRLNRLSVDLGRLGLTPSDRSKVIVQKKTKNKFDDE